MSNSVIETINKDILEINTSKENSKKFRTLIKKKQLKIAQLLEKKMNLVTKNHYRNIWLSLGMAAFGIPLGVSFGASLGNMGLLGVGLPIGMLIGMAIGKKKDEKAQKEGRQLNIDLRY